MVLNMQDYVDMKCMSYSLSAVPSVSVQIVNSGATTTAGENYQLKCTVTGAENLNPFITYRWTRNIGSDQTPVEASSNILSFTPQRLADAAIVTYVKLQLVQAT